MENRPLLSSEFGGFEDKATVIKCYFVIKRGL